MVGDVSEADMRRVQIRETIISHLEKEAQLFAEGIKCLSLFFIPCFKWNKQYFVQSTCCNTVYALDPEIGRAIARGENVEIRPEHLTEVQAGYRSTFKRCSNCGFETQEDFEYCPKCGRRF